MSSEPVHTEVPSLICIGMAGRVRHVSLAGS